MHGNPSSVEGFKRGGAAGSVYLHVLASSVLVTIIGLAALAGVRIQTRCAQRARDYAEARSCAVSAVELGLLYVTQDPDWRTTWTNGTWLSDKSLGDSTFTLEGKDPQDGDLADSQYEPLILTGIGSKGIARHKAQVTLVPVISPLEALNTCLHAAGVIHIGSDKTVTATGAPISTNGELTNRGTLDGDAAAAVCNQVGTITGTLTVPAETRQMPLSDVITAYAAKATVLSGVTSMDKIVLGPGCNPWGAADPNGLYYLDTGGNDLTIQNSRIYGTLIVRVATLHLNNAVLLHAYRSDLPVLLVDGNLDINYHSGAVTLSEPGNGVNYNPFGALYEGRWDDDQADEYPSEIRGLIHVVGSVLFKQTARVQGVVICDGEVTYEGANTFIHDPDFYASPPEGYTCVEGMQISPGSWRQVVD
jgi:hypothetical protein